MQGGPARPGPLSCLTASLPPDVTLRAGWASGRIAIPVTRERITTIATILAIDLVMAAQG